MPCFDRHTDKGICDCNLEPHPVSHLQTRLRTGHGLSNSCHITVNGEVEVIKSWENIKK